MWTAIPKRSLSGFREPTKDEHAQLFYKTKDKYTKTLKRLVTAIIIGLACMLIVFIATNARIEGSVIFGAFISLWILVVTFIVNYEDYSLGRSINKQKYRVITCTPHRIQVTGEIGQGYKKESTIVSVITEENQLCMDDFEFNEESPYLSENEQMLLVTNNRVYKLLKIEKV